MESKNTPKREAKHMNILAGIGRLKMAKNELQSLYDEIVGATEEETKQSIDPKVEEYPTLVKVLCQAGDKIVEEAETIIKLISKIRDQIL